MELGALHWFDPQVDDTNEVAEAKANFYQLFEEARKQNDEPEAAEAEATTVKVEEAEVSRARREEELEVEVAEAVEAAEGVEARAAVDAVIEAVEEAATQPEPVATPNQSGNFYYFNQMLPGSQSYKTAQAPKLVYHPYYGFVPAAPKKEEAKEEAMMAAEAKKADPKMAYVFDPYYGYIPYVPKTEAEMENKEQQKFEYHPYFGYIPVNAKNEMAKEEEADKLVYHPYYGFIRMSQLKGMQKEMNDNQRYVFDPLYGYIPVAKKAEGDKMAAEEMVKAAEETAEMVEEMAAEEVAEKVAEEVMEEVKEEVEDEDKNKFYFHPFYGFIPVSKLTDEKLRKGVNMDMKYVLHPYFGFIPESKKVEQKKAVMPYNPYGYKFLPYQPMKNYYMYNTIGDKMNAMTAKAAEAVAEPVAEAKTEEAAVEQRRKRSPVYVVPVPQVHQYPASTYPLLYSKPDVAAKTEETAEAKSEPEPDTKALLEEQPNPVAPVTQIKPVFNLQPYYYAPYAFAEAKADNNGHKVDIVHNFPVTPIGATVAQSALPENEFPYIPYDPDQDKPAALAF